MSGSIWFARDTEVGAQIGPDDVLTILAGVKENRIVRHPTERELLEICD